jgi:hypothetical protein
VLHQHRHLVPAQTFEPKDPDQPADAQRGGGRVVRPAQLVLSRHRHDRHPGMPQRAAEQRLEQQQRRQVGGVQVVDDDEHGLLGRDLAQVRARGVE